MTTPAFLKSLAIPRAIKGQSGNYWQVAANASKTREFFVRLKFERVPYANESGKVQLVEGLQVNLVYLGDQFEVVEPFAPLDVRPYLDGEEKVQGILLAKVWVPMGEFHKNMKSMYEFARDTVSPKVEARFAPLFEAAEVEPTIKMAAVFNFLIEDLTLPEVMLIPPEAFVNQEWLVHVTKIQKQNSEAMAAMKATAAEQTVFQKWEQSFNQKSAGGQGDLPKQAPEFPGEPGPTTDA